MERALTLKHDDSMGDWYSIEWAEHENRMWLERTDYGGSLRYSGRVSDADVEGTADEMAAIARAIEDGGSVEFRRCAVRASAGRFLLWSPRNSEAEASVSREQALHLAAEIRRVLAQSADAVDPQVTS